MVESKLLLKGVPASPGQATGTIVLYDDLERGQATSAAEAIIVVGESIPPEVTSLAKNVVGVVTDTGGPLCHTASLARELGIPAVVGTHKASEILKPGTRVRIDGLKGEVHAA
jgi:pyruvate,water dikinase